MRSRLVLSFALAFALPLAAQQVYTAHDYAQSERWMSYNVHDLVQHTIGSVDYLKDGRIFYRDPGKAGVAYMLADPAKGTTAPAFDNAKLAAALETASKHSVKAEHLNIESYTPDATGNGFTLDLNWSKFHCDSDQKCSVVAPPEVPVARPEKPATTPASAKPTTTPAPVVRTPGSRSKAPFDLSPDTKLAAFIRDNNLWVRTEATGEERQLTTDGIKDFGYATDNAGWTHSDAPILIWSPDSTKIATFQMDERKTGYMYLVPVTNRHPVLEAWHYPLVGDKDVTMIQRVVIDVASAKVTRLNMPPDEHRSTECDDVSCRGGQGWDDVEFSPDGKTLAFVSTSRDHKDEWLRVADTATGSVRDVYHEHVDTYYGWQSNVNWKYLPASNEFLWCSERSNYAQYYLYDLTTGKLRNQVTHGEGPVQDVSYVDEKNRVLYFIAAGKEKGEDPYFQHLYRVDFDGKNQQLLTPENANHVITAARDGSSFVDVYSTVETPQTSVVRDNTGKVLLTLAKQDISQLLAAGWKVPKPITVPARDGKTTLYGIMWKPTYFDETKEAGKKYPIIDYVYPGPQDGSCGGSGGRSFRSSFIDAQSLADLGFIVVCIDGMGNPHRSKSFHDAHASKPEDMGDDTIPDQVSGIKDLASRFSYIDIDRVGIWGHSGGGNATVSAMFHFPDFFKVGWAESGNHDNRDYEDDWDERWAGLEVIDKDGKSNYDAHANQNYAKNLKGHLMLAHGTMDDNVPPNNTFLVADALIKANKDFDLLLIPNAHHGYGEATQYVTRRRWDYFVRNLAGGTPPSDYQMKPFSEIIKILYGPSAE
jgi:dipeptidyl aminopeptidase/acylaminoacyl peptidase